MFGWKFWRGRVSHQPRSWFTSKLGQKKQQKRSWWFVVFCGHWSWHRDMSTWHPGKNDHGLSPLDLALETPMREMLELKGWRVEGGEIEKTSSLFLQKTSSIMQDVVFFSRQSNFIKSSRKPSGMSDPDVATCSLKEQILVKHSFLFLWSQFYAGVAHRRHFHLSFLASFQGSSVFCKLCSCPKWIQLNFSDFDQHYGESNFSKISFSNFKAKGCRFSGCRGWYSFVGYEVILQGGRCHEIVEVRFLSK